MKVKDLMSTNITCVNENTPILQLASHMRQENIGSLPVCDDNGRLKGIVTDRDIVLRAIAVLSAITQIDHPERINRALSNITAKDIMTTNPVSVSPNMDIHDASLLLSSHQVRRLPVTEASKIIGMISLGDIASRPVYIDEAGDVLSAISIASHLSEN